MVFSASLSTLACASAGAWVLGLQLVRWTVLRIFLRLPSTLAHELCHWLVAMLTASSPSFPNLLPKKDPEQGVWVLGSVGFVPSTWTAAFVALAPVLLCLPAWLLLQRPLHAPWTEQALCGWAAGLLLEGARPSSKDFRLAFEHPLPILVITLIYLYYGPLPS